jgi:threonine/homoserine/homoserine lactone efflux protein
MLSTLLTGLMVGLAAGITPGPLLTLVLSVSLRSGVREGLKVAISPALTDLPIIILALVLVRELEKTTWPLGLLSLAGAVFIAHLAWHSIRFKPRPGDQADLEEPAALRQGVLVNLLNPHPYLFWFTVGVPLIARLWVTSPWLSIAWIAGFYSTLLGSKIALAILFGRGRAVFNQRGFAWTQRCLGIILIVFAVMLTWEGVTLLGVV